MSGHLNSATKLVYDYERYCGFVFFSVRLPNQRSKTLMKILLDKQ